MPLTDYQAALARLLSQNRTFDSYLAGGAAILIEPETARYSHDLDYFHDSEVRVAEACAADRKLLEAFQAFEDARVIPAQYVTFRIPDQFIVFLRRHVFAFDELKGRVVPQVSAGPSV